MAQVPLTTDNSLKGIQLPVASLTALPRRRLNRYSNVEGTMMMQTASATVQNSNTHNGGYHGTKRLVYELIEKTRQGSIC